MAIAALAIVLGGAWPAVALDGVVRLPDGRPVADATVTILGRAGSTRTDAGGSFTWSPDPAPPFDVLVVLPGGIYSAPITVHRLPTAGARLEIEVLPAVQDTVTVEAGSTPFTDAPPASAATLLPARQIALRRPGTLAEALEGIPGVGRLEEGHSAVPSIRGLARGRTLLLLDGGRITAERRAGASATFLDPFFLEAIEVSRGFGSVAWGSDAFGGIIHARTRRPEPGSAWSGRLEGALGAGVPERALAGVVSRGLAEGGLLLQGRYRSAGDYRTPHGREPNSSFRDAGVGLRFEHEAGPGRLAAALQADRGRDIGKPALDSLVVRAYYPREDADRLTLSYEGDPRGRLTRWSAHAFVGRYRLVTDRDRFPSGSRGREISTSDVSSDDYGLRASAALGSARGRLEVGVDLNGRRGLRAAGLSTSFTPEGALLARTEETSVEDAARADRGVFATVEARLHERLNVSAGLRGDHVTTRNRGGHFGDRRTSHSAVSAYGAVIAGPVLGAVLTAQVGTGFRDPTLSDRYFRGTSGRGFVTGLPTLEPERSLQYDVALRRGGRVRTALYLYRYRLDDLVERYRDGNDFFFRNRGQGLLRGVELEVQADLGSGWTAELAAQAARGRAKDDGTPLADVPAEAVIATVRRAFGETAVAYARATLLARDADAGPTEKATPGSAVFEAGGSWRLHPRLEARLALRNLLDHAYPQTPDEAGSLAPGRSGVVTLSARF